jgi:hypothetical protein
MDYIMEDFLLPNILIILPQTHIYNTRLLRIGIRSYK